MKKKYKILIALGAILILFRALLPEIIRHHLNEYLDDKIPGYTGFVGDFDLSLYRGAYQFQDFTFNKKNGNKEYPFIYVKEADVSVSWKALFRGRFLLDLDIKNPKITMVDSENKEKRQFGISSNKEEKSSKNWVDVYTTLVPFKLETLQVSSGEVLFKNFETKIPVELFIKNINLFANNIHNSLKNKEKLVSSYKITALAQNHAKIESSGKFNILSKPLSFDISGQMENLKLKELNSFLEEYVPLDLTKGRVSVYLEFASKDNKLIGYVKPVAEDIDVISGKENINSLKRFGFEYGGALANLFFRHGEDKEVAAKIPIEGTLSNPDIGVWEAIKSAFKNAFGIKRIEKKVDNSVNLKKIK